MQRLNQWPAVLLSLCAFLASRTAISAPEPVAQVEPEPAPTSAPATPAAETAGEGEQGHDAETAPSEAAPSEAAPPEPSAGIAEPSPVEPPPSDVIPPRVRDAPVEYPSDASGSAEVLLELVVKADGSVSDVRVLSGPEPFASAASQASSAWKFEPATRAGVAVSARIHFMVRFVPPSTRAAEAVPTEVIPAQAPERPPATEITEVFVLGEVAPGVRSMGQAEARMLPGAMGDPFNAIAVLPGVAPVISGLPLFLVRGAPPANLGYFVDGVRIPLLYHAFLGPAVIHPALIERVELYSGGYPASFGRFAGGVVSADTVAPTGQFNGEWSVRLVDAGAFVEAPFAGGRGNAMLGGRYSYTALLLSLFTNFRLEYWDYQGLVRYDLGAHDELSLFAFGAYDFAGEDDGERNSPGGVEFHRIDLRHVHRFGPETSLRSAVTLGLDRTKGENGSVHDRMLGARMDLKSRLAKGLVLRAGANATLDTYRLDVQTDIQNYLDIVTLFPSRTDFAVGAYMDSVIDITRRVQLTPGVRVDLYGSAGSHAVGVSPRLAARFSVTPAVSIVHALGLADQPPAFFPAIPGVAVAGLSGGLQRAFQSSAGVEILLPDAYSMSYTLFNNAFFGITDPISLSQSLDLNSDQADVRSLGQAYGLEAIVRRPLTRRFGGFLSYTLSRSTRSHDTVSSLAGYDRTHVLNLAGSYDIGHRWIAGARFVGYSGVPGSRGSPRVFDGSRSRPFLRLDLRLEKRFPLGPDAWWGIVFEMLNATFSREVLRRDRCEIRCSDEVIGPVPLPSIGVMGQY
jgi:TonB family protein